MHSHERNHGHTVFTKNQCFAMVSASKKNSAPTLACDKKSFARLAIYLKSENPAPDLSTKRAIACWMMRPTITVGLHSKSAEVVDGLGAPTSKWQIYSRNLSRNHTGKQAIQVLKLLDVHSLCSAASASGFQQPIQDDITHTSERESKSGSKHDAKKAEPSKYQSRHPRKPIPRLLDEWNPYSSNRLSHHRIWYKPKRDSACMLRIVNKGKR